MCAKFVASPHMLDGSSDLVHTSPTPVKICILPQILDPILQQGRIKAERILLIVQSFWFLVTYGKRFSSMANSRTFEPSMGRLWLGAQGRWKPQLWWMQSTYKGDRLATRTIFESRVRELENYMEASNNVDWRVCRICASRNQKTCHKLGIVTLAC